MLAPLCRAAFVVDPEPFARASDLGALYLEDPSKRKAGSGAYASVNGVSWPTHSSVCHIEYASTYLCLKLHAARLQFLTRR